MEIRQIFAALMRRRLLTAIVLILAVGAAVGAKVALHPQQSGAASVQLLVDAPAPVIADFRQDTTPLIARAPVLAQVMASSAIQQQVAAAAGIPADELSAAGPFSGPGPGASATAGSPSATGSSGSGSAGAKQLYQLNFSAQAQLPLISVSATAPSTAMAAKLANAVGPTVAAYLNQVSASSTRLIPTQDRVVIRQLGTAQTNPVSSSSATVVGGGGAIGILVLGGLLILTLDRRRLRHADAQSAPDRDREEARGHDSPVALDGDPTAHRFRPWSTGDPELADEALTAGAFAGLIDAPTGEHTRG